MTTLYLDCEFNGHGGDLISMALVSNNGHVFYEVLQYHENNLQPWVRENVMPYLAGAPVTKEYFASALRMFLLQFHEGIEFIADSPADFRYLMDYLHWINPNDEYEMLGLTSPVKMTMVQLKNPYKSLIPHNAYEDAKALMHQYLHEQQPVEITLESIYNYNGHDAKKRNNLLYDLLNERTSDECISHKETPTFDKHCCYVESRPYREWYFIEAISGVVGTIAVTRQNEIAISVFKKYRRKGYAKAAIQEIINKYPNTRLLANINPNNQKSIDMFEKLNFRHIQNTYEITR